MSNQLIYISSSCIRSNRISASVEELAKAGYSCIELSGGTELYPGLEEELLRLKQKYSLNYLCHNYFPPPQKHFVVNLASLDETTFEMTRAHLRRSLGLSSVLGASRFGFHAGFLINIPVQEIGKPITQQKLFDREPAMDRFVAAFEGLKKEFPDVELYLENNVLSEKNLSNFQNVNPLFLCDAQGYAELREKTDFKLLLDVAHLKVSCNSLNLNLEEELNRLVPVSDYIHISDNDGKSDSNQAFRPGSELFSLLRKFSFENKICTVEVYGSPADVAESYETVKQLYV